MKKFTNAAAASVLAGALVIAGTPAQAAEATATTTATETTAATAPATTAPATDAPKLEKPSKQKLTWQERQERDRGQIDITSQRLDNAKKGLEVTDGIINSAANLKDLFTPRILKDGNLGDVLKIVGKLIG